MQKSVSLWEHFKKQISFPAQELLSSPSSFVQEHPTSPQPKYSEGNKTIAMHSFFIFKEKTPANHVSTEEYIGGSDLFLSGQGEEWNHKALERGASMQQFTASALHK